MNVGMLWFDEDKSQAVKERIERAAAYYCKKYGRTASLCFMNSITVGKETIPSHIGSIRVQTSPLVLQDHFWIGVDEKKGVEAEPLSAYRE